MSKPFAAVLAALWLAVPAPVVHEPPQGPVEAAALTGRVLIRATPPGPPASMSPYGRRRAVPPQQPGTPAGAEDAFVYLERTDGAVSAGGDAPLRIVQRDRTIMPHASVARVGQLVEFPNEDDIFHNLFSLSPGNRFSLGRYAPDVTETHRFEETGVVRLFCDIHSEMAGVILVVDTPHVVRVGADGSYSLASVPSGTYHAIAWHPSAGADTTTIELADGATTTLDFTLGR